MKCSINLLVLATVLLFSSAFCNHEYHNHHRDDINENYEEFHHEINITKSNALKNSSGNFTALQQGSSFDDFKEKAKLGLGAIISIPIVGVIFVCCCCYWCCRCCCGACRNDTQNIVVMNSNETQAVPPPQIIVQPIAVQPQFQQIPQTQYVPQPPYAPPPGYSEFSPPSNYRY